MVINMKLQKYILILLVLACIIPVFFLLSAAYPGSAQPVVNTAVPLTNQANGFWRVVAEIITVIFGLSTILIAILIMLENRNPSRTVAWLLILLAFPVLGFILYILFGQNLRKKRKVRRHFRDSDVLELDSVIRNQLKMLQEPEYKLHQNINSHKRLINLVLNNSSAPFTINNRARVLTNGQETFAAILDSISKAKDHLHLEYYIVKPDNIGRKIQQLLIKKARQGVEVRLLYDGVGGRKLKADYLNPLKDAGAEIAVYLPVKFPFFQSRINYRNHRKIVVVDGMVGYVGGLNIGDEYLGQGKLGFWRDTHMKLEGEAVYFLQRIFLHDWHFATKKKLTSSKYFPELPQYGSLPVQIATSGPDTEWASILQSHFAVIVSARERIYITSPYFVPDESILMALKTAALSGVDVKLILPSIPDYRIVFWASMSYLPEVIEAGVKVYLYQKGFMHAKVLLVDGVVASVGTTNMDMRSFNLNFEVNALIYDKNIVKRLEEDFYKDLEDSRLVTYEECMNKGFWTRFKESSARLLSPIL